MSVPEWNFPDIGHLVPFLLSTGAPQPRWNVQRFLEALIIAAATAGVSMYAVQERLSVEISHLNSSVQELKSEVRRIQSDVYVPRGATRPPL